ncbi:hypothetical protein PROFUN_12080 [Planoprotostelium fungivorum]|uniref:Uncharacterized protein n=2 Tax=Planoprotostelium fungivorum TaxID=1890364 RepID=A0A2P6N8P7_9EUKA|nr:hypothetical protein PROFUN_12080 [Planoprotostelium fungivorum]
MRGYWRCCIFCILLCIQPLFTSADVSIRDGKEGVQLGIKEKTREQHNSSGDILSRADEENRDTCNELDPQQMEISRNLFNLAIPQESIVDDCCCSIKTVSSSNYEDINPILNQLAKLKFFRYFKVHLEGTCPFWATQAMCMKPGCSIDVCRDDEVPECWKDEKTDLVDVTTPLDFVKWRDTDKDMWTEAEDHSTGPMSYVDLQRYPEGNTGYDGRLVWDQIYQENCFKGTVDSMCLEERVFFRLVSGMHASINTHIAHHNEIDANGNWIHNYAIYEQRIHRDPSRIRNLYFAFLFLLRAMSKVEPVLRTYSYHTGDEEQDRQARQLIDRLLQTDLLCSPNFDESTMFNDPQKDMIKRQFRQHFRNISMITDCVTCEKCRVYSKLQVLGLGTALKILFSGVDAMEIGRHLQRNEVIALVVTARQFSNSIEFLKNSFGVSQTTFLDPSDAFSSPPSSFSSWM